MAKQKQRVGGQEQGRRSRFCWGEGGTRRVKAETGQASHTLPHAPAPQPWGQQPPQPHGLCDEVQSQDLISLLPEIAQSCFWGTAGTRLRGARTELRASREVGRQNPPTKTPEAVMQRWRC